MHSDSVFYNGHIHTLDPARPTAQALAVYGGKIVAVGSNAEIQGLTGPGTQVIDLKRATVVPGFHDAHCHILLFGFSLIEADLRPTVTIADVVSIVAEHARAIKPGRWVRGGGYNNNKLAEQRHPTRHDFDAVARGVPVWILHISGHMGVANTRALALAGITRDTPDPEGGVIVRDPDGEPTGLLLETAQELIKRALPPYTLQETTRALAAAGQHMAAEGITSAQDMWGGWIAPEEFRAYQEASADGSLPQRVRLMVDVDRVPVKHERLDFGFGLHSGFGTERLKLGAIKLFLDGSLIGRTAALSAPYIGSSDNYGLLIKSEATVREQIQLAHAGGWQVAMHAIGDRAIELGLNAIEAVMGADAARFRPRIEHCGVLRPDLIARIQRMGVLIVTQPRFLVEIGDGMRAALGEARLQLTYPMASLRDTRIAFSSDRPVVAGAPLLGMQAAVVQCTASGAPYVPAEAITIEEALRWYTVGAAYSVFEEHEKGVLAPGMWADFVALSDDPLQTVPTRLNEIAILQTVVGGKIVFAR